MFENKTRLIYKLIFPGKGLICFLWIFFQILLIAELSCLLIVQKLISTKELYEYNGEKNILSRYWVRNDDITEHL